MSKSSADDKILSYNDVVLRRSDLDILSGPYFLNDRVIEFYFSHLSATHTSDEIFLVPPSIAFWILNCPDLESLKDFLSPLKFPDRNLVIFPVNNNNDVSVAEGGTHWSLLAYERNAHTFVHHDSNGGTNKIYAMQLYKTVLNFMDDPDAKYIEWSGTPQQVNGYDCGMYIMAIARVICEWHVRKGDKDRDGLWLSALREEVTPGSVSRMRKEVLGLIRGLMAKE